MSRLHEKYRFIIPNRIKKEEFQGMSRQGFLGLILRSGKRL
jgi:hypothetical protein